MIGRLGRLAGSLPVRIAVSLALLGWLFTSHLDLGRLIRASTGLAWPPLVAAVGALIVGRLLVTLRWKLVLGRAGRTVSFGELLRVVFVTEGVGLLAPGNLLIEGMRMFAVSPRVGTAAAVSSVVVERSFAFAVMAGAGGVGMLFADLPLAPEFRYAGAFLLLLPTVVLAGLFAFRLPDLEEPDAGGGPVALLRRVAVNFAFVARAPRLLFAVLGLTVAMQGIRIAVTWLLSEAVGLSLDPHFIMILGPVAFFSGLLPVSMMGLGVREVSFVPLLALAGIGGETAVLLGLLHVAVFLPALVLPGLVLYLLGGVRLRTAPRAPAVEEG